MSISTLHVSDPEVKKMLDSIIDGRPVHSMNIADVNLNGVLKAIASGAEPNLNVVTDLEVRRICQSLLEK